METLFKFEKFVDEINKENGRLYKQSILEKYKDDEDIKFYLHWIFSPYVITGISDKKLNKVVTVPLIEWHSVNMKFIFDYLSSHKTGTDLDIGWVQALRAKIPYAKTIELYDKIITKNVILGVDAKTINKIIPDCIETFNVQLANKYFEKPEKIEGKEFAITTKIDGGRIIAIKENGNVTFYTRQGQVYEGLVDLEEEMKNQMPDNICLDGEITLLEPGKLTSKDQYKQTMKITRADGEKHGVKMLVFDCMPAEMFRKQACDMKYSARQRMLCKIWGQHYAKYKILHCAALDIVWTLEDGVIDDNIKKTSFKYFELLPILYTGNDTGMVTKILDEQVAKGEEGIMLNVVDATYKFDRTWSLQKVKKMQTLDLEVVDYFEGKGALANTLGGFIVRYKNNNLVKVGSGFDKEFRIEAWKHPKDYIGKIIEVQYFEETTNQSGGISLRFPVFKDVRSDKTDADF